jgi:hypothetical protein
MALYCQARRQPELCPWFPATVCVSLQKKNHNRLSYVYQAPAARRKLPYSQLHGLFGYKKQPITPTGNTNGT